MASPLPGCAGAWINAIYYDNVSVDVDEGVEIAAPACTHIVGWSIELYKGSTGKPYAGLSTPAGVPVPAYHSLASVSSMFNRSASGAAPNYGFVTIKPGVLINGNGGIALVYTCGGMRRTVQLLWSGQMLLIALTSIVRAPGACSQLQQAVSDQASMVSCHVGAHVAARAPCLLPLHTRSVVTHSLPTTWRVWVQAPHDLALPQQAATLCCTTGPGLCNACSRRLMAIMMQTWLGCCGAVAPECA